MCNLLSICLVILCSILLPRQLQAGLFNPEDTLALKTAKVVHWGSTFATIYGVGQVVENLVKARNSVYLSNSQSKPTGYVPVSESLDFRIEEATSFRESFTQDVLNGDLSMVGSVVNGASEFINTLTSLLVKEFPNIVLNNLLPSFSEIQNYSFAIYASPHYASSDPTKKIIWIDTRPPFQPGTDPVMFIHSSPLLKVSGEKAGYFISPRTYYLSYSLNILFAMGTVLAISKLNNVLELQRANKTPHQPLAHETAQGRAHTIAAYGAIGILGTALNILAGYTQQRHLLWATVPFMLYGFSGAYIYKYTPAIAKSPIVT